MTTPNEFKQEMQEIANKERDYDCEIRHVIADNLMCAVLEELGYSEGVKIFEKMDKWYA